MGRAPHRGGSIIHAVYNHEMIQKILPMYCRGSRPEGPLKGRYEKYLVWSTNLFSGVHVEAKDGGINSSLWKPKINV